MMEVKMNSSVSNTKKARATILVFSCDSYEDAWEPMFTLMDKYWENCKYDIVINTESKDYKIKHRNLNIRTLGLYKPGKKVPYGKRSIDHLKAIETDYIITLMDDFFLRAPVDQEALEQIMDWMDGDKKIASFSLVHHDDPHSCRYKRGEQGYKNFSLRPRYTNRNYDMQVAIWRREALIKSWRKFETPWEWEAPSNIRSFDDGYKYYDLDEGAPFPVDYIDYAKKEWSGIRKGKWVKETVFDLFESNGIVVDYEKRGFFDPEKDVKKAKPSIRQFLRDIRCYGNKRRIRATLFRFRRLFAVKIFRKKDYPDNYCNYLRHKYYDKY